MANFLYIQTIMKRFYHIPSLSLSLVFSEVVSLFLFSTYDYSSIIKLNPRGKLIRLQYMQIRYICPSPALSQLEKFFIHKPLMASIATFVITFISATSPLLLHKKNDQTKNKAKSIELVRDKKGLDLIRMPSRSQATGNLPTRRESMGLDPKRR